MKASNFDLAALHHVPSKEPTLRVLANLLNLSRTTISDALRGNPRVSPDTAERVRSLADKIGYRHNPLTGTVMSMLRKSRAPMVRGNLAVLDFLDGTHSKNRERYNTAMYEGIKRRAEDFGFGVELFQVGKDSMRVERLDVILTTRGIQGLLILPSEESPDAAGLRWSRYAAVYLDYYIDRPALHALCPDHHRSMATLLHEIQARGYRRPGLFMEGSLDERLQYRWEGAYIAQQNKIPGIVGVPILHLARVDRETFKAWFRAHTPDVVIGHCPDVVEWMRECGAQIPSKHGFVCLNHLRSGPGITALDLQASQLGARGTEFIIAQLLHNEFGIPEHPSLTTLPARLIEGETLGPKPPTRSDNDSADAGKLVAIA